MTSETISLIANIALALSAIIALAFGIVQVKTATRDRQERLTLEALRNFNTREFSELMNYVTAHDIPPTHEDWQKLPANEGIIITQFAQDVGDDFFYSFFEVVTPVKKVYSDYASIEGWVVQTIFICHKPKQSFDKMKVLFKKRIFE